VNVFSVTPIEMLPACGDPGRVVDEEPRGITRSWLKVKLDLSTFGAQGAIHKQEVEMPTYISLLRFTQKGVESIKDGPKRLDDVSASSV
jgi:hypothetical protein